MSELYREYVEVGPGTFWVGGPGVGHGHRCIGDEEGVVLAVGAPPVHAPGLDPHELDGRGRRRAPRSAVRLRDRRWNGGRLISVEVHQISRTQ